MCNNPSVTKMKQRVVALILALACLGLPVAHAGAPGITCRGRFFNPMTINWMDLFPITIAGVQAGPDFDPPLMREPPVCICPSHLFGIPSPGLGVTYWEPLYVAEVERVAGCFPSLGGGATLLSGFSYETGGAHGAATKMGGSTSRLQVHWYVYPVFQMLDFFTQDVCMNSSDAFALGFVSEIDPVWQNDLWANLLSPESALFDTLPMQMACVADAASADVWVPLDPLFWCAGSWGSVYPFSGTPNTSQSDQQANALVLSKFLAMEARLGMMLDTIGPQATCFSVPNPVWIKTQFRINPVYPLPTYGLPIYIGQTEWRWGDIPPANFPLNQSSVYMIWNAQQCCLRF